MADRQMDTYGYDEMAVPQWRLVQNVGAEYAKNLGAKPGNFYNSSTDEIAEELEVVVVDIRKQRTYWGRTEIEEAPPECSSSDGITSWDGKECSQCEYRCDTPWAIDATKRRQMCTLSYNILCLNTADSMPCLIRAGGINALPTRQLLTSLRLNKNLNHEYHRALIRVTSTKKKTSAGEAYTMHFKIKGLATGAQADELKEQSLQLLGAPLALPEAEAEEPIGYTPEGQPVYTEEEKEKVLAELGSETKAEDKKAEIDLNF